MTVDRTQLPHVGLTRSFEAPTFSRSKLSNGARVWTASHRRAPVLTFRLLIPVGSADDPPGRTGLAGLTADLLDEGTRQRSDVELHRSLMQLGAHLSVQASSDATVISLTTLARHAARSLELLVDVVSQPRFDPVDCERVRDLRLTRIRQMRQAPSALATRALLEQLYPGHPYGHLAIGREEELGALEVADVIAFHERWYGAGAWTLVAVGDLPAPELDALVSEALGDVAATTESHGEPRPEAQLAESRLVLVPRPRSVQSEIRLGHVAVGRTSPDYHALLVLNMVLGGQFISRMNRNLREEKGYTYGARTSFDWRRGAGPFSFQSSVQTDATADALAEAIREIREVREERPPTDAELEVACAALTRGFPRGFETASQVARAGTSLALHRLGDDEIASFESRVEQVSRDDVLRVALRHLHPERLLGVVVGSPDDVLPTLGRLGLGEPLVLDS